MHTVVYLMKPRCSLFIHTCEPDISLSTYLHVYLKREKFAEMLKYTERFNEAICWTSIDSISDKRFNF